MREKKQDKGSKKHTTHHTPHTTHHTNTTYVSHCYTPMVLKAVRHKAPCQSTEAIAKCKHTDEMAAIRGRAKSGQKEDTREEEISR